jgi:CMP-N-acetylneuraminic acid synthetase
MQKHLAFDGCQIICQSTNVVIASNVFDRVIVSSEGVEVVKVPSAYRADRLFIRPPELDDDHAPMEPVIA